MVLEEGDALEMQRSIREVFLEESLKRYIVALVGHTREYPDLELGSSPRGSLALMRCSQAIAAVCGRDYVQPDDIKRVAVECLAHRLIVKSEQSIHGLRGTQIVEEILRSVPPPTD